MHARLVALVLLAALVPAAGPALGAEPLCDPSPAAATLLEEVGSVFAIRDLSRRQWDERLAAVERALAERPEDLFLHRLRQDLVRYAAKDVREARIPAIQEEYGRLAAEHPGDAAFQYLHGRIADGAEEPEKGFAAAVAADPDFPWGHLGMVVVEARRQEPATEAAERHLARFAELCPNRLREILAFGASLGTPAFWRERVQDLRARLEVASQEHASAYPNLWALEFRLADVAEHGAVRERVARDVERLAALEVKGREVLAVLQEGYELTGQPDAAAGIEEALVAAAPCSSSSVHATQDAWEEEHPPPGPADSKAAWTEWLRLYEEASRAWVERCPDEFLFWHARFFGLSGREDADPEELIAAAERAVELYGRWQGSMNPLPHEQVAQVFLEKRLALDRAEEILGRGEMEAMARRERRDLSSLPEDRREELERSELQADWQRDLLRARLRIARGETAEVESLLAELALRLEALAPPEGASGRLALSYRGLESELWLARAERAEAAGRLPDALAFLLEAELARPADAPPWVRGLQASQADERIPELWARLGGSPDGLTALRASRAAAAEPAATLADFSPWTDAEGTLPEFQLQDLSGRVWTLADLAGKTVFANAWATWCGPCRAELPAVQALHERLRGRDDVLVLTFNMDSNLGSIAPYVEQEGLAFPVLLARDFLRDRLDVFGIPQSWIVDGTGRLRREQGGFDSTVEEGEWVEQVIAEIEGVAGADPGPGG